MTRFASLPKLFLTLALVLSLAVPAGAIDASQLSGGDGSVQLLFAQLQLELSEKQKQSAQYQDQLADLQARQNTVSDLITQVEVLRDDGAETIPPALASAITAEVPNAPVDGPMDAAGYDRLLSALEDRLAELAIDTQAMMAYVQDFLGQYNASLSAPNTGLTSSAMTGLTMGGTMLGSGMGLGVTCALGGLAVGVLVTLLLTRKKGG